MALMLVAQPMEQQQAQSKSAPLPDAPQTQGIPDAPKPQTSGFSRVAPGKGTTPTSNGESGSARPADPDQETLPPTPTPAAQRQAEADAEQGAAPVTPSNNGELETLVNTVNAVEIPFTVKDSKGRLVPGLNYRDVRVYENNVRQHITVWTVDPYPLSVAVVVDQSMPYDTMARVNNALGALQGAFTPYDEVAVFTYNNGPKAITPFTAGQSPRLTAAIERSKAPGREPMYYDASGPMAQGIKINGDQQDHVNPLTSGGPGSPQGVSHQQVPREVHALNDAILMAAQATAKAGRGRRRIVYVISDGKEYGSTAKPKEVIKYLQRNNIEVCATVVGDSSVEGLGFLDHVHIPLMMRDNILPVYTLATGGQTYVDYRQKGIESSFAKMTEEVRTQYTVWYNTREPFIDGKFRKVEVKVLRPNLQVIAKDGYYPSAQDTRPSVQRTASPASR